MFNDKYSIGLEMFNSKHLITLLVLALVTVITVFIARKIDKDSKQDKIIRYMLASSLLILEVTYHVWVISRGEYNLGMIPFTGFCALTNLLTIYYLYTNNEKIANMVFFYALTGAFFSLIFIDTTYVFPHFRNVHYFYNHFVFLLSAIYSFVVGRVNMERKIFNKSALYLITYTLIILIFDLILKENWFYLFESPVKEISDFFGKVLYTPLWLLAIYLLMNIWYFLFKFLTKFRDKK
ncbi:TMEM164-related integral membrane acyltransferase [Haploplasma modicum]|uniref:TMEM164-related integral membrane acyltransferase n=1 Tax=Haploplasma modicum TaxID=2150 RepID=UPI00214AAA43|nr:TIGR02206 family membrane protein [Haploplasma modicum]MCR1808800.1 TIGR02206 family membrane protein [Haploplasma modicum]